jgi:hypothetical protein
MARRVSVGCFGSALCVGVGQLRLALEAERVFDLLEEGGEAPAGQPIDRRLQAWPCPHGALRVDVVGQERLVRGRQSQAQKGQSGTSRTRPTRSVVRPPYFVNSRD